MSTTEPPPFAPAGRSRQGGRGSTSDRRSDNELLAATPTETEAFGEFYLRHVDRLFLFFRQRCNSTQDAYDLVSETFAQMLTSLPDFDEQRGEPAGWLFGIAKNKLRRSARQGAVESRARRRLEMSVRNLDLDSLARLEESLDLQVALARLQPAIDELPEGLRGAVQMRCLDDESYEHIASVLEIQPAAARKRVSRGLRELERLVADDPFAVNG